MTQQSTVLLIAFLVGLAVAAVLWRAATRNILPRAALAIAGLAIPIWVACFASSQGHSFLASKGFLNTMPDALWFGLTCGVFTAAFFLALGYVYGDAKRRNMPCVGVGDRRFAHTQFDWVHPVLRVPKAAPWSLQFLWQAYSQ